MTESESRSFTSLDWLLLASVALMWGASFLLIDFGIEGLRPAALAWLRLFFGVAALLCFPAARRTVPRHEGRWIALLGLVWMAVPFILFPVAQQWITSSLAGMINGAAPLFTAALGAAWYRRAPRGMQLAGLLIGALGVVVLYLPSLDGSGVTAAGVGLILLATVLYGVAFNLAAPLQRRNGALPVILRAQIAALVLVTPFAVQGLALTSFSFTNVAAMVALGVLCTGLAFAAFTTLVGRVGAARGSVTVYLIPVVAIVLGISFRGETVSPIAIDGTVLILGGAFAVSRSRS